MRFSSTACTVFSLLDTVNNDPKIMQLSSPVSLSNTVYNHPRDALLWHCSSEGWLLEVLLVQPLAHWLRSSTPLVPSLVFWEQLQSSMGCFLEVPPIQSPAYGVWSTIIQGMRFLCTFCAVVSLLGMRLLVERWYIYWSTGLGLQSSTGYVYFCPAGATIDLSVLVYNHPGDASITALSMNVIVGVDWSYHGWNSNSSGPCALVHSQSLSFLPSSSIIQDILPYFSSGYEPGSQGIFIQQAFRCIVLLRSLTLRATSKFAARRPQILGGTTKCNVALLRLPTIHHSATRRCPMPLSSWRENKFMLTMICPASHYSDVHAVNLNS